MNLAPWHTENWQRLVAQRAHNRLPHALLLCGPAGLGVRDFAERIAAMILCESDDAPCGACHACRLFAQRFQRDPEETRPDDTLAQPQGHPGHPDARFVGHVLNERSSPKKMYSELTVDQIRELSAWLVLPSQLGRAQVALIDPADELNHAAANALLKTLEEPGAGRHLVLVSSRPARLSATIRSRCQRIEFHLPAVEQARAWLATHKLDAKTAAAALEAASGNPGLALELAQSGGLALRAEVQGDLAALRGGKACASQIANRWSKSDPDRRLWFAALLVGAQVNALTAPGELPKLAAGFDRINRAREQLRGPLRTELVILDALSALAA
ncbi:MAG: DNA polymerase III subunit delta' [Proteobacteria bacterium]|nr:DNA polymerase III subunit delta' [Pseudomonadota bacterium]